MSEAIEDAALRAAELAGDVPPRPVPSSQPLLALLRRTHTMAAERKIHDALAGPGREPEQAGTADAALVGRVVAVPTQGLTNPFKST